MIAQRFEVTGDTVDAIAAQIPLASTLEPGAQVVVRPKSRGLFAKLLASPPPSPAVASALLARGYVAIRAMEDEGRPAVTGEAPASVAG
jgi:hypothetical protein